MGVDLEERMAALGASLADQESKHAEALAGARGFAERIHARVASLLERFHAAALARAPQLEISQSPVRTDDKHLRAVEFELARGRHRAIVTVKSKGEITLVGPFRLGKTEGPCRSFPVDAEAEIEAALGDFLVEFIEEAAHP